MSHVPPPHPGSPRADALVDGTRFQLPPAAAAREGLLRRLSGLYDAWGYRRVEVPALERYRSDHPRAAQAFKLTDHEGRLLALRSDFTPALARLVRQAWPYLADPEAAPRPTRLRVAGPVWHARQPELARIREFTQVGIELVGASDARADAELIHLARESVRAVGLHPRVEIGTPGFVKALMDEAGVPDAERPALADAIDRKDVTEVTATVRRLGLPAAGADALRTVPDLYGGTGLLGDAERVVTGEASARALARLAGVLAEFEDDSELILDLGMARRLAYYTGVTFRAYTPDFGQPLLGGGRYDGALLPYAAGFSIGLDRLVDALPDVAAPSAPRVLALDDAGARRLREAGTVVVRAVAADREAALAEAGAARIPWLLDGGTLLAATEAADPAERAALVAVLEGAE